MKNRSLLDHPFMPTTYLKEEYVQLDEKIRTIVGVPVIKIGSMFDEIGGGTLKPGIDNSDWQAYFLKLAKDAKLVFVVPIATYSSKWEIRQLFDHNLLNKSVFILPSIPDRSFNWLINDPNNWLLNNYERVWNLSKEEFMESGITMPDTGINSMFVFSKEIGAWRSTPFTINILKKLCRKINADLKSNNFLDLLSYEIFDNLERDFARENYIPNLDRIEIYNKLDEIKCHLSESHQYRSVGAGRK